jgi:hypothetical protein
MKGHLGLGLGCYMRWCVFEVAFACRSGNNVKIVNTDTVDTLT